MSRQHQRCTIQAKPEVPEISTPGSPSPSIGKLLKTVHLLNYLDERTCRRTIEGGLNPHEQCHSLAHAASFGNKAKPCPAM